jgi:hypothetical protein
MRLIWLSDSDRLPAPAALLAIAALSSRAHVELPDDAIVIVEHDAPIPGQLLTTGTDADGNRTYFVASGDLEAALAAASDEELRTAGIDPTVPWPARRLRRLLRRRLPHWTTAQIDEVVELWPRIADVILESAEGGEEG